MIIKKTFAIHSINILKQFSFMIINFYNCVCEKLSKYNNGIIIITNADN